MSINNNSSSSNKNNFPSTKPETILANDFESFVRDKFFKDFKRIEEENAKIAELIFDYLINVEDQFLIDGSIPPHSDSSINLYIKLLNKLFALSRKKDKIMVINRRTVKNLDKKAYMICLCFDGGDSLDILCDIVNEENMARIPSESPTPISFRMISNGQIIGNIVNKT